MKISVIGSGGWGTALSILLIRNGHNVTLWSHSREESESLSKEGENKPYLPGIKLPEELSYAYDLEKAVKESEAIVTVVPSQYLRGYAREMAPYIGDRLIINCTKGLEQKSLKTMSECIMEEIKNPHLAVLTGPSHAEEVARFIPTTVVASSFNMEYAEKTQEIFMCDALRVYTNTDLMGVEIGGALKNVIALCAGMIDGIGFGDNTKAALMTRGLAEITRLGVALGGRQETFMGLSGIGDLIVTCTSPHSRNRRAGILLGQGKSLDETLKEIKMVTEGITSCSAAYELSKKLGVEMPIVNEAYKVLYENKNPKTAVLDLMMRDKKEEL